MVLEWKQVSKGHAVGDLDIFHRPVELMHDRSYPIAFGLKIQRCWPVFTRSAAAVRTLPAGDALAAFAATAWGDSWPEAELIDACLYLRGSIHLRVSRRWRVVFPENLAD